MGMLLARGVPPNGRHDPAHTARFSRRLLLGSGLGALAAAVAPMPRCRAGVRSEADASRQARDDAVRSLPLSELTAETRRKLMAVIEQPSLFRRLPEKSFECDPGLYLFLIRNPEVVVNIWQVMGVSNMTAERRGQYLWKGNDGAGTICDVELVYGTPEMHIVYSDGYYEGALLKRKLTGRCVLLLKSGYRQAADRRWYVANRLDIFLQVDNTAADVVTRTLAPLVGRVADANFEESCHFASKLSLTAEQNSAGVQRLADRLTRVDPPIREEFSKVAAAVQQRAALRDVGTLRRR